MVRRRSPGRARSRETPRAGALAVRLLTAMTGISSRLRARRNRHQGKARRFTRYVIAALAVVAANLVASPLHADPGDMYADSATLDAGAIAGSILDATGVSNGAAGFIRFHLEESQCPYCNAVLEDLRASDQEASRTQFVGMRDRLMRSTRAALRKASGQG